MGVYKIYKITHTPTGRFYIGLTKQTLRQRFLSHLHNAKVAERRGERLSLCDGSGNVEPSKLAYRMVRAERRANIAEAALADLQTHVALYIHYSTHGTDTNPGLKRAPGPSPYPDTWMRYLKAAARAAGLVC